MPKLLWIFFGWASLALNMLLLLHLTINGNKAKRINEVLTRVSMVLRQRVNEIEIMQELLQQQADTIEKISRISEVQERENETLREEIRKLNSL